MSLSNVFVKSFLALLLVGCANIEYGRIFDTSVTLVTLPSLIARIESVLVVINSKKYNDSTQVLVTELTTKTNSFIWNIKNVNPKKALVALSDLNPLVEEARSLFNLATTIVIGNVGLFSESQMLILKDIDSEMRALNIVVQNAGTQNAITSTDFVNLLETALTVVAKIVTLVSTLGLI